ncbi:hypothetical protein PR202_ga16743 [Eleusine coracana subsp. coracana]|uniref:Fungal lipase-type domain-containing protein n=1 Tax=Eleusine coracana subsp. coracana TaxID=191504 RepID=A0AAV5CM77_ELECO|nr:hypothetical protein PR202_ga16743 [Eleusine coracana subsp. coracana]
MAKRLLSRTRLIALDRPILTPALTRFLSGDPLFPTTSEPEDKGKKAAAAAATAVVMEARAKSRREEAEVGSREGSEEDDEDAGVPWTSWRPDGAWLSRALEPALHLYKQYNWKSFTCSSPALLAPLFHFIVIIYSYWSRNIPASTRTFSEILSDLQRSKISIKDWSLSDLTIGLYLIYLSQASAKNAETFKGVHISSNKMVCRLSLFYIIKYSAIDPRAKLVILGIRGTHTVYDLVTDLIALSDKKDYKLRLVGHSLGGASAALLAIMLRKKSKEELGFSPDIISAVGYGTPPCVSREVAESCASYVSTVVLQDDIIPRLSAASLARLRTEILKTDWVSVLEKEDWKHIVDIVTNAKLVVSSIQDVARKLGDYAKFVTVSSGSDAAKDPGRPTNSTEVTSLSKKDEFVPEDLFLPGTLYYLQRDVENIDGVDDESYTLWRGDPGENFQRILLSGNLISDHKCESIYYALRDVLKTLPATTE